MISFRPRRTRQLLRRTRQLLLRQKCTRTRFKHIFKEKPQRISVVAVLHFYSRLQMLGRVLETPSDGRDSSKPPHPLRSRLRHKYLHPPRLLLHQSWRRLPRRRSQTVCSPHANHLHQRSKRAWKLRGYHLRQARMYDSAPSDPLAHHAVPYCCRRLPLFRRLLQSGQRRCNLCNIRGVTCQSFVQLARRQKRTTPWIILYPSKERMRPSRDTRQRGRQTTDWYYIKRHRHLRRRNRSHNGPNGTHGGTPTTQTTSIVTRL